MHRVTRTLPFALIAAGLAACGGNSSGPDARFACLGDTLPTTAPASITVSGTTEANVLSPTALAGVEVIVSRTGTDTLGVDTSSAPGRFSISVATGGTPLDGHLQLKKSGYLPTYAYPARPMAANDSTNVVMLTSSEFTTLAIAAGITPQAGKGFIGVIVRDCSRTPLAGATVSTNPGGTLRYAAGGIPSQTATATDSTGLVVIANVTAGNVTIMATASGHTLRQHVVNARADAITLTEIQP